MKTDRFRYPITLKFAGKVGDILTPMPPENQKSSEARDSEET
ncbi:hypothetical protein [Bradyrhizobium sp. CCBAU 11430]|nr:hypothetical protein [Bradyrhizobium sp. CCBAU 11430]